MAAEPKEATIKQIYNSSIYIQNFSLMRRALNLLFNISNFNACDKKYREIKENPKNTNNNG